jgi:hypothetical protein
LPFKSGHLALSPMILVKVDCLPTWSFATLATHASPA